MKRILAFVFYVLSLASCDTTSKKAGVQAVNPDGSVMQEGKDYVILKRFRVMDQQGFSQFLFITRELDSE